MPGSPAFSLDEREVINSKVSAVIRAKRMSLEEGAESFQGCDRTKTTVNLRKGTQGESLYDQNCSFIAKLQND